MRLIHLCRQSTILHKLRQSSLGRSPIALFTHQFFLHKALNCAMKEPIVGNSLRAYRSMRKRYHNGQRPFEVYIHRSFEVDES